MARTVASMRRTHDKYWGTVDNINSILFVVVALNPRYKLEYVKYCFWVVYNPTSGIKLIQVETLLHNLLEFYGDGLTRNMLKKYLLL